MTTNTLEKLTKATDINSYLTDLLKQNVITPELLFEWISWGHYETLVKQLLVDDYTIKWRQAINKKYYIACLTKEYMSLAQRLESNSNHYVNEFTLIKLRALSEFLEHRLTIQ